MAGLRLEHIYKVYPNGTKAVSDFTMEIKDKEFIVFVGPSGCGKSTTLRMIAGLEDISAGELYIGDDIVNDVEPKDRDIAMVFQNYALYPHMTVYENMAFGLKLRHVSSSEIHEKVLWAAKILDLTEYLDRKPKAMSGGQRQRVALGRAILRNPKVMLLDEPLSNLDAKLRTQMRSEIAKLHENLKTTFIYVTHDQVEAMTLGTRVVVMKLGKVMQIDTPKNLYDYPANLFVAGFIGTPQMNFFHATLSKDKDMINIDLKYSEESLVVSQAVLAKVQPQYFDGEKTVVVGLRCEHLSLNPEVVKNSKYLINVKVSHFEELGNETLIYGDINMDGDGFTESSTRVIIKGTSNYGLEKGSVAKAAVEVTKMHMFDIETQKTINPRIPSDNLVSVQVKSNVMTVGELSYNLPTAINLADGNYEVLIPTTAISLSDKKNNQTNVVTREVIEGINLVGVQADNHLIFTTVSSLEEIGDKVSIDLDFTQIRFIKDKKVVQHEVPQYDKINGIFLNHETVKSFVGGKYDEIVQKRLQEVDNKFLPKLEELKAKYEADCVEAQKINSAEAVTKNAPLIQQKKVEIAERIKQLKTQYEADVKKLSEEHALNNATITKNVEDMYTKIYNDEIGSFESFKRINKDKDAYRKRASEIRTFKSNFKLEKKNELEKQINLEALRYESDVNAIKGSHIREIASLKQELNDFVAKCNNEAYPLKVLTKQYNKDVKDINKQYKDEYNRAALIFFFKTNDLITLASDEITNKMIQGLGVKVFTKQYILEIPHNAYQLSDAEGLELKVVNFLDYGVKKYIHCQVDDAFGIKDIYIESDSRPDSDKINVKYDVTNIHITEKSMDIKIY